MTVTFKLKLEKPCVLHEGSFSPKGYGLCTHKGVTVNAHRLAYCEHHGLTMDDIKGIVIRHRCDTPACIEPTHLIPGTHLDNKRDSVRRRRHVYGARQPLAKLTDMKVREIKRRLKLGQTQKSIAAEFGVGPTAIGNINVGLTWKHVVI